MSQPLVIAYHLIWTAYGTWLPNDPRGSGSHVVRRDVLADLGELHYGRKRIQPCGREIREFYATAAGRTTYDVLSFSENERALIGAAFGGVIRRENLTCYACVVMPDHVHILVRKHRLQAEEMMELLKTTSRNELKQKAARPEDHPVWTGGHGWTVFLNHPDEVRRTIPYVERNPLPLDLPVQRWEFVKPYDGWPLHPGHDPGSPYAARLRAAGRYP